MKPVRTWILIADGGRARLLENLGPGRGLHQLPGTDEHWILPPSRELLADRPGRSFESHGVTRHALEPASDPHRELKRTFARHLTNELAARHLCGHFDRLILVAPAQMMGDLRAASAPALAGAVVGSVVADLTHVPTDEIAAHLAHVLID